MDRTLTSTVVCALLLLLAMPAAAGPAASLTPTICQAARHPKPLGGFYENVCPTEHVDQIDDSQAEADRMRQVFDAGNFSRTVGQGAAR